MFMFIYLKQQRSYRHSGRTAKSPVRALREQDPYFRWLAITVGSLGQCLVKHDIVARFAQLLPPINIW